jgi:hypothetical protein
MQLLERFGAAIAQPLGAGYRSQLTQAEGITPGPQLSAAQRLGIYNEQYWLRLFKVMGETYPAVTRLYSSWVMNQKLVVEYVTACKLEHWSVDYVGQGFVKWLEDTYHDDDRELVVWAARVDWAVFEGSLLSDDAVGGLKAHVSLWHLPWAWPPARQALLERDADGWMNDPFPKMELVESWWLLGRGREGTMVWKRLSRAQWMILSGLREGKILEEVLEGMPDEMMDEVEQGITSWFMEWAHEGFLAHECT